MLLDKFTVYSPFIASAMHHARNSPIKNAVTCLKCRDKKRTSGIVFTATGVSHAETA